MKTLLCLELISCAYMTGLILLVHFIHYPSFALIRESEFKRFSKFHASRITPIVLPGMVIELGTSATLAYLSPSWISLISLTSVAILWLITGLMSAPTHTKLSQKGFTPPLHRHLMKWNRVRTCLWTLRLISLSILILPG